MLLFCTHKLSSFILYICCQDSLLPSPFVDDNKRVGTHQQTNGHRNVFGSSQVSENEPVVKSRDKNTYPRGNIYEILPRAEAPLHTCAHNNQVVEPNKKRSRTTESTLGMSKVSDINFAMPKVEAKTDIFNHRPYQKENMNQISIPASNVMKQWQTTVAKMSPQSTSSKPTSDSDNSFNKSITVVVAEVHAEPGRHCSFSQHSALLRCDRRYNNESLLTTSALTSDEEADVSSPKDECSGDSESRSDTGIGQSMSEDEFTFIKDETSLSRRINEREDSNDALSMMLINDCLLFEDDDDVDHEFILNRCHVMAEVLVHSG